MNIINRGWGNRVESHAEKTGTLYVHAHINAQQWVKSQSLYTQRIISQIFQVFLYNTLR